MQGSGVRSTLKLGNAGNMEQTALWLIGLLKPDSRGSLAMRHEDGGGMGGVGGGSSSVLTLTLTLTLIGLGGVGGGSSSVIKLETTLHLYDWVRQHCTQKKNDVKGSSVGKVPMDQAGRRRLHLEMQERSRFN